MYLQFHILKAYSLSNLNRNDQGKPKTITLGGFPRLRISSQCLKRRARTSEVFTDRFGKGGQRTKEVGQIAYRQLVESGMDKEEAFQGAFALVHLLDKGLNNTKNKPYEKAVNSSTKAYESDPTKAVKEKLAGQALYLHPHEIEGMVNATKIVAEKGVPTTQMKDEDKKGFEAYLLELFLTIYEGADPLRAIDIAMFGRMFTSDPGRSVDGAVSMGHAITTHMAQIEDDYFCAVDDMNEGTGAAHLGTNFYGSGVFYQYCGIDLKQLISNLSSEKLSEAEVEEHAKMACAILLQALATTNPTGMQKGMTSKPFADYIRVEKTDGQPMTLDPAFMSPVDGDDLMEESILALENLANKRERAYGDLYVSEHATMNVPGEEGSFQDLVDFINS